MSEKNIISEIVRIFNNEHPNEQYYYNCGDQIFSLFEELGFFKPVLKKWYAEPDVFGKTMIYFAYEIFGEDQDILGFGVDGQDNYCPSGIWGRISDFRGIPATEEQISYALTKRFIYEENINKVNYESI